MFHAGVVTAQIGNAYACRTEREGLYQLRWRLLVNRWLQGGVLLEIGIILALIYVWPLSLWFEHLPLSLQDWAWLAAYPLILLVLEEGRKWLARRLRERRQHEQEREGV